MRRCAVLVSDAFERYRQDVIVFGNQSKKTEENHLVCLRALLVFFGDTQIETISFEMVRLWKLELEKGRSPETVRNYIVKFRNVLRFCERQKLPVLNYQLVIVPKRQDKVVQYLNKEQIITLINATDRIKNKCIVSFLYASGLRVSEICKLDKGQIRDNSFTVVGKGGKARLCFIDDRTNTLLDLYLETRHDSNPALFLSDMGIRITPGAIQETFKTIRKRSGIECHPHTLRHSFATNLLQTNTNLYHVSKLLGHAQLTTTQQYLHAVDYDLEEVYRKHHTI